MRGGSALGEGIQCQATVLGWAWLGWAWPGWAGPGRAAWAAWAASCLHKGMAADLLPMPLVANACCCCCQ